MTSTASKTFSTVPMDISQVCRNPTLPPTGSVQNGHTRYALLNKHVDDVHDRCVHRCSREILVCTDIKLLQRLSQLLCLLDVHSDEFQYAVLSDDANDHGSTCLVIAVDNGDTPGARLEHLAACFVYGSVGVDGYGFYGFDAQRSLNVCLCELVFGMRSRALTSQTVQAELVDPRQSVWVLPVVLYDVYIV